MYKVNLINPPPPLACTKYLVQQQKVWAPVFWVLIIKKGKKEQLTILSNVPHVKLKKSLEIFTLFPFQGKTRTTLSLFRH
jgi:hypothetical protein